MDKKVISFELTEEQYVQLDALARIRKTDANEVAKDAVCIFLAQVTNPITSFPHHE